MPYKDQNKAKAAAKERMQRYRAKQKGVTQGVTDIGAELPGVTDDELFAGLPPSLRVLDSSPDWKKEPAFRRLIYHLKTTPLDQLQAEGLFIPCWRYSYGQA